MWFLFRHPIIRASFPTLGSAVRNCYHSSYLPSCHLYTIFRDLHAFVVACGCQEHSYSAHLLFCSFTVQGNPIEESILTGDRRRRNVLGWSARDRRNMGKVMLSLTTLIPAVRYVGVRRGTRDCTDPNPYNQLHSPDSLVSWMPATELRGFRFPQNGQSCTTLSYGVHWLKGIHEDRGISGKVAPTQFRRNKHVLRGKRI